MDKLSCGLIHTSFTTIITSTTIIFTSTTIICSTLGM
jgi:hypothetical protein